MSHDFNNGQYLDRWTHGKGLVIQSSRLPRLPLWDYAHVTKDLAHLSMMINGSAASYVADRKMIVSQLTRLLEWSGVFERTRGLDDFARGP